VIARLLLVGAVVLVLSGCGTTPQEGTGFETTNGKISGRVVAYANPIQAGSGHVDSAKALQCPPVCSLPAAPRKGAPVRLLGFSLDSTGDSSWTVALLSTDSLGRWSATLPPGRYVVYAGDTTFVAASYGQVTSGTVDSLGDLLLAPPIDLVGRVVPQSGQVDQVRVCAAGFSCTTVGADSVWTLRAVPRGALELTLLGPSGAGIVDVSSGVGAPAQVYIPDLPLGPVDSAAVVHGYGQQLPVLTPMAYDSAHAPPWYAGKDFGQVQVQPPPH
jgi:hypothetical protein